jgi:branched-chain amino acid transport system ATP-binding protein
MILALEEVSKAFGGVRAVEGLDLSVEEGEIFSLIGPNGAGKTTVFNLITGVYRPDRGRILFRGRAIHGLPPYRIAQLGILRTFQTLRLFPNLTVEANVLAGFHLFARQRVWQSLLHTPAQAREERNLRHKVWSLLEALDLLPWAKEPVSALPYGLQRRVELARALAAQPRLLILDEPAAGLNEVETRELGERIQKIREQGITILLVEHDMSLVMSIADRIAVLNFGRRIALGRPEEIQRHPEVIEAYLGQEEPHAGGT